MSFVDPLGLEDGDPIYNSKGFVVGYTNSTDGTNYLLDLRMTVGPATMMQIHEISDYECADIRYKAYLAWRQGTSSLGYLGWPGGQMSGVATKQLYYHVNNRNSNLATQNSGYNSKLIGRGMEANGVVGNSSKSTDPKANELRDKVIESMCKSTPKYYGGSNTLKLIGGVGLIGGLSKISKASMGLRKVGEASETSLLSSAIFYKLGIRGFAPFKVWTPFGYARTWETILGRWTAPAGGSILMYDYIENNKKK